MSSSSRSGRRRKRRRVAAAESAAQMSESAAKWPVATRPVVVASVSQPVSLGQVPKRRIAAAAGSAAQLEIPPRRAMTVELVDGCGIPVNAPGPSSSLPVVPIAVPTAICIADSGQRVELSGIVGRLISANKADVSLRIKSVVDSMVSAFIDGHDVVAAQTSEALARRAEGRRGEDYNLIVDEKKIVDRKLESSRQQNNRLSQTVSDMEMTFSAAFAREFKNWDGSLRSVDLSRFSIEDRLHGLPESIVRLASDAYRAMLDKAATEAPGADGDVVMGDSGK